MTKQDKTRLTDLLNKLANSMAEQERTVRAIAAIITSQEESKPKPINNIPSDQMSHIEKLLEELLRRPAPATPPSWFEGPHEITCGPSQLELNTPKVSLYNASIPETQTIASAPIEWDKNGYAKIPGKGEHPDMWVHDGVYRFKTKDKK